MALNTWTRQGSRPLPYTITLREDGRLSCDCPGWTFQRAGQPRTCKHTREIAATFAKVERRGDGEYVRVNGTPARVVQTPTPDTKRSTKAPAATKYRPLMLADKRTEFRWSDFSTAEWAMEQKFDGERVLAAVRAGTVTAWSRARADRDEGLPRDLASHISAALAALPDGDYDGELIVKGQGLMSKDVRALMNRAATVFVIFDILALRGADLTEHSYDERRLLLTQNVRSGAAIIYPTSVAPDRSMYDAIIRSGGEGIILKRRASRYTGRRSADDWVKVKQQAEAVVTITGFEDSKVNASKNAVILFRMENGVESKCKVLNNEWARRIAAGDIRVGTQIEITYQTLMPKTGKPRHAMAKRVVGDA